MRRLEGDTWRSSALRALPMPAWLAHPAEGSDVVLSCRVRLMRNLAGYRFPLAASTDENLAVMDAIVRAAEGYEVFPSLTKAERDHYVATRLLSPDFPWTQPGRAVLLDRERTTAVLINEEDHLRLQVVLAGSSWEKALESAEHTLNALSQNLTFAQVARHLTFAQVARRGFLAASIYNAGEGRRISAMLHLIGLVTTDRIREVLPALNSGRMVFRGLFGESSKAIGAYAQVSTIAGNVDEFRGALNYLVAEERRARAEIPVTILDDRCEAARNTLRSAEELSMLDAVRLLGLLRWGAASDVAPVTDLREIDYALCVTEFRAANDPRIRAENLRHDLNLG